eukprot:snap_masked-scaffold_21-processed-gene-5.94-mRNA-1 protein AED:1.00 eAED:1.00 QI:0/-1/0/0/-1/1/1/0/86
MERFARTINLGGCLMRSESHFDVIPCLKNLGVDGEIVMTPESYTALALTLKKQIGVYMQCIKRFLSPSSLQLPDYLELLLYTLRGD